MAFTSWYKIMYECGRPIACLYDQSKSQPYCRQWPRLLTVSPISKDAKVELRYCGLSVPWNWLHNCNWELWERCVSFINGIRKLKWSSAQGIYNDVELSSTYSLYKSTTVMSCVVKLFIAKHSSGAAPIVLGCLVHILRKGCKSK